ncbi:MetS family NSS transporter small subunit [Calditrichota bacterium]
MPLSAWLMLIFGCLVLYGGFIVTLIIAIKAGKRNSETVV